MRGVLLPGGRRVGWLEREVPEPGPGQVLLEVHASSLCGSDLRAIYREHLGRGAEAYRGVIAGHEPAGRVVATGPGVTAPRAGERVCIYHIAGCGQCEECRRGYPVGCTSQVRAAYGWQRDGGHAPYLLAEAASCIVLPDALSYVDGALVSCGFGTAYEALLRVGLSGRDSLLVTGLGPVGLAACMLGRALGAGPVVGADVSAPRRELAARLGLVDAAVDASGDEAPAEVAELTAGGATAAVDCSGSAAGRLLALRCLRPWGRCALVGEGGELTVDVSALLIHRQLTVHGSWVTSLGHLHELVERLAAWGLHPETTVTSLFPLSQADAAYREADAAVGGKVCLLPRAAPGSAGRDSTASRASA